MGPSLKEFFLKSLSKSQNSSTKEVNAILKQKNKIIASEDIDFGELWEWGDYGLKETSRVETNTKKVIQTELAKKRFLEAYYIEKAGMTFAAKMSLLSESIEEQKLFSHFAAEEAAHFSLIESLLTKVDKREGQDLFIKFLNEVIASGERRPLIFIIQVVLEGWGIDHYGIMERTCKEAEVKQHLKLILKDEASHHGSGVSLFKESDLSESELNYTMEMMGEFIKMVRVGPVSLFETLKKYTKISASEFCEVSNAQQETQRKLNYLKNLMQKAGAKKMTQGLEPLFKPDLVI